jgi:hypothetical protein
MMDLRPEYAPDEDLATSVAEMSVEIVSSCPIHIASNPHVLQPGALHYTFCQPSLKYQGEQQTRTAIWLHPELFWTGILQPGHCRQPSFFSSCFSSFFPSQTCFCFSLSSIVAWQFRHHICWQPGVGQWIRFFDFSLTSFLRSME